MENYVGLDVSIKETSICVGPVVTLTFRATIDVPARFTSSKSVGAVFGLTPSTPIGAESGTALQVTM
jgi:hypothetical protein